MAKKKAQLSERIRQAVRDSGLTHYRICQQIGISEPMMSRFMHGHCGLSMAVLDRLAELLDFDITMGPSAAKPTDYPDRRRKEHKG